MTKLFNDITFANPSLLWLLLLLPLLAFWYLFKQRGTKAEITLSFFKGVAKSAESFKMQARHLLFVLRCLTLTGLIIALARPQSKTSFKNVVTEGIDIVLSMDISSSMLSEDFKPNRLEVSKEVAQEFIANRPNDRIGCVVFGGESFTQCPLTSDHSVLVNQIQNIKTGILADGTAIGSGLGTAVSRLKDSKAKSKVIILLTDGVNNAGSIPPLTAAEIARTFGIKVYTIAVGTYGKALSPVAVLPNGQYEYDYVEVKIDEKVLGEISNLTGGNYFRATTKNKLREIYQEIDKLEKTIIEEKNFTNKAERFLPFVIGALVCLLLEIILRYTIYKTIP